MCIELDHGENVNYVIQFNSIFNVLYRQGLTATGNAVSSILPVKTALFKLGFQQSCCLAKDVSLGSRTP